MESNLVLDLHWSLVCAGVLWPALVCSVIVLSSLVWSNLVYPSSIEPAVDRSGLESAVHLTRLGSTVD
eukprot:6537378-Lingulodinium_polyedra.AAC.1